MKCHARCPSVHIQIEASSCYVISNKCLQIITIRASSIAHMLDTSKSTRTSIGRTVNQKENLKSFIALAFQMQNIKFGLECRSRPLKCCLPLTFLFPLLLTSFNLR